MTLTILVVDTDADAAEAIAGMAVQRGFRPRIVAPGEAAMAAVMSQRPHIVIAAEEAGWTALSAAAAIARPGAQCIVMAGPAGAASLAPPPGKAVCGVARIPPDPRELALLLQIATERIETHHRLRREKRDMVRRLRRRYERQTATERFLTVKQVVDKVSTFIGEMAREVEGGVRYFNEVPYFIAIHDRNYRVTAANRAYRVLLGHRAGDPSWKVYDSAAASLETCPVGRTFQTETAMELHETLRYRSGARVPVIVHTAPIYDNNGVVTMVLEVSAGTRDIHQLREDLRSTQQRYQQLFDAVPCHVAVLDRDRRFTAVNRHFTEAFKDRTGEALEDVFTFTDGAPANTPIDRTYTDGSAHHGEMTLITEDWRRHDVLVWTSPLTSAAGKLIQVLLIFVDITQIRTLQDNLSFLGLMIASISHSIKGVLAGLDAGVYTLEHAMVDGDDVQIREGLDLVSHMAERIRKITMDILFYAKERELNRSPVPLPAFFDDVTGTLVPRFDNPKVSLAVDTGDCDGHFTVDGSLLKAALVNIVENALDACVADHHGDRQHRVTVAATCTSDTVTVTVTDDGVGMNEEQLKKLFTVFYSTKGIKGTGLGLFIADTIIRQHGGDITVASRRGHGSRFCIKVPRHATDAAH